MPEAFSRAYAGQVAPAKIITCCGIAATEIRDLMARALNAVWQTQTRLAEIDAASSDEARSALWNLGPEFTWFATYDSGKYRRLKSVFERIDKILSSKRLDVICDSSINLWGEADPAIWKLHLGKVWIDAHTNGTDEEERIQTFIHESAHIAGRWVVHEGDWYGKPAAEAMAHETRPHRPRMALRSADNIGYYAMEVAARFITDIAGPP